MATILIDHIDNIDVEEYKPINPREAFSGGRTEAFKDQSLTYFFLYLNHLVYSIFDNHANSIHETGKQCYFSHHIHLL